MCVCVCVCVCSLRLTSLCTLKHIKQHTATERDKSAASIGEALASSPRSEGTAGDCILDTCLPSSAFGEV
jgi:hypothetical protein